MFRSLPMRERELKPLYSTAAATASGSLPMRERELKLQSPCPLWVPAGRSPCGSVN